jgi:hypothetical protein
VILANKFAEVQKHLALTNHQYNPQSLIFSKKVWDTLSADEKKIVQDAAVEAGAFQRQVNRDAAAGQLDALKKAGMQVTEFSAAEQAKLRDKLEARDRQARRRHRRHRGRAAGRAGQAAQVIAASARPDRPCPTTDVAAHARQAAGGPDRRRHPALADAGDAGGRGRHQGLRLHYQLIDLDRRGQGARALPTLLDAARTMGFAGLNITYPCKQAVIPLLDDLSDEARAMGAVNTVVLPRTAG